MTETVAREGRARRPGRPRSAAAEEAIVSAVIPLIREVGYDAFTIEALAARAGVGKATIYRRWATKEDLTVAAINRFVGQLPIPDTGSIRSDLAHFLATSAALQFETGAIVFLSTIAAAMARSPRIAQAVRGGFVGAREAALAVILRRAQGRGELPSDLDLDLATEVCGGPLLYRALITPRGPEAGLAERLADLLLGGLANPIPTGDAR